MLINSLLNIFSIYINRNCIVINVDILILYNHILIYENNSINISQAIQK